MRGRGVRVGQGRSEIPFSPSRIENLTSFLNLILGDFSQKLDFNVLLTSESIFGNSENLISGLQRL